MMMESKPSLKVTVVMGGPSAEHEISLKSGHGVVRSLSQRGWSVEPLRIPKTLTVDEATQFTRRALQQGGAEVVFIALHGVFGEDGTIQQLCETLDLAYTGSDAVASRLGIDKVASKKRFEALGLSVPRWQVMDWTLSTTPAVQNPLAYPLVVKPNSQGSSLGISIVRRKRELTAALKSARRYSDQVVLEEFVPGREVTVGVLGDEPLPIIEIRSSHPFFDYTAKYTAGLTEYLVPAPLPPAIARVVQQAALTAHRALGCRHLSRTDLILTHANVPLVLEVNTIPGFTPTSLLPKAAAACHISYEELCERLVLMAWQDSAHLVQPS